MASQKTIRRDAVARAKELKGKELINPITRTNDVEAFDALIASRPLVPPGKGRWSRVDGRGSKENNHG